MKWTVMWLVLGTSAVGAPAEPVPSPSAKKAGAQSPKTAPQAKAPGTGAKAPGTEPKAKAPGTEPKAKALEDKPPGSLPPLPPPAPTRLSDLLGDVEAEPASPRDALPPGLKVPPIYRQPFVWDVPRVLDVVDVPGVMLADGVPVRLKAVRSAEKPEPLLQHMVDRWEEWGLYITPAEQQPQLLREPMLTALDPERFITYTVILQPNPDGTTTVYLGEADMSKPPATMSSVAPVFPGAEGVMTSDLEVVRSVNYTVSAKEAEVEAFYRTELGKAGFKPTEPRRFRAGQEEVELILKPLQPGKLSVAVLRRTTGAEPASPTSD
ncbi:hypothetical protein [Pyxidicoccus xibeiensis]|uniref:hypothetical protein n=1 Tax=Pyxidicoccus xibeiensis TaxID=2906759 RepID=UPI0020A750D7|nr:hypothetical protein [Pyxidicoccus xibeiensis]MCP3136553.1 hypothetical protein [Pyxidicoccus xibeiensis]